MEMILSFDKTEKIKVPDIKKNPIYWMLTDEYDKNPYLGDSFIKLVTLLNKFCLDEVYSNLENEYLNTRA